MNRFEKFVQLAPADRQLILRAGATVVVIRAALWVVPFRWLRRRIVDRVPRNVNDPARHPEVERFAGAVADVSRFVPGATCLTQALATQWLLNRSGIESSLRIGVGRDELGVFRAHAWVVHAGRVVIGGNNLERFAPLPAL